MFHYSIKEHVFYAQEREKISYPVDFGVFNITHHIFFVYIAQFLIHPMQYIGIYLKILNKFDKQLAINLKLLRGLVLLCDENEVSLSCM